MQSSSHPFRVPGHRHEELAVAEKALRRAFGVFHRDRRDELVALVEIFDAKTICLQMQELARDLGRGIEAQRIGADEIFLRLVEFFLGRAVVRRGSRSRFSMTAIDSAARSFLVDVPPENMAA